MATKRAGELQPDDGVNLGGNAPRVVERVEFVDQPIDSDGTTGIRVWWQGRTATSTIAVDKELEVS